MIGAPRGRAGRPGGPACRLYGTPPAAVPVTGGSSLCDLVVRHGHRAYRDSLGVYRTVPRPTDGPTRPGTVP
eukprot:686195-Hanusia_phi.AAC.2